MNREINGSNINEEIVLNNALITAPFILTLTWICAFRIETRVLNDEGDTDRHVNAFLLFLEGSSGKRASQ